MLLVVAWDGASSSVLDDFVAAGELPTLAALRARGAWRDLRSTVPAVTFPAWTTFMTGASPARHGITDFTVPREGGYGVRFVNASYRSLPTIWALQAAAGRRVGVYAFPATYPPERLEGGMQVPGFDTPLGASGGPEASCPAELAVELRRRYGSLGVGGPSQARIGPGWHEQALTAMLEAVALRARIVCDLLGERRFDCFAVHFGESDTVAHHYWQFHDPAGPRHRSDGPGDAVLQVYRALDAALARLLEAAGPDADVALVSDHGSGGAAARGIFWNRFLADAGLLAFGGRAGGAAALKRLALAMVPGALQPRLFARLRGAASRLESAARLGGIDWTRTAVYSEEVPYYPSFRLNLRGRDPLGIVAPADAPALLGRLRATLAELRDPYDGQKVVERVSLREELFEGAYADRAPDLVAELRRPDGYAYWCGPSRGGAEREPVRALRDDEMTGAKGTSMSGAHTPLGIALLAGPRVRAGVYGVGEIADAGASVLALAGLALPAPAEGRPWSDCLDVGRLAGAGPLPAGTAPRPYGEAEEAEVAERLRALGYLT